MKTRQRILITVSLFFLLSFNVEAMNEALRYRIAEDVLSRMEPDFFFFKEKERNVEKLLRDSNFKETDLNDDGKKEIIVKVDWRSDGHDGFSKGYSFVRGAHGQGKWQIYGIMDNGIIHLGTMTDGNVYELLPAKSSGYKNIETWAHDSYKTSLIDTYAFSNGRYQKVSSVLYELNKNGTKNRKIETYK